MQILADTHGAIVHLGERDCSIQRRHQKVVEEAPSPALDPALRARIGDAAIAAARSVGYTNAGTVEFLLAADGTFAFLEMNARLQVEHPVTELVYGVDLVHEQLRIASGEALRFAQADLVPRGAAIEVRLNAEDPAHDYAPQAGTIATFAIPENANVRVDTGVRSGSEVPVFYDSLLAKIIVHGADRAEAVARLRTTLAQAAVTGIATNLPLLRAIANDAAFRAGDTTTSFLTERGPALDAYTARQLDAALIAAGGALVRAGYGWRAGGIGIPIRLERDGVVHQIAADRDAPFDETAPAHIDALGIEVTIGDTPVRFAFASAPSAKAARAAGAAGSGNVTAPMPGKIVRVAVKPGDTVMMHDLLIVLEAMKMEHRIDAPLAGTVGALHVAPGDLVAAGAALVTIGAL
jgi:acetyl/propionyl-CoA carboxylase alpha subunit